MNTLFLLMAQYDGLAIVPLDVVCEDYFQHLTPEKLLRKVAGGEIDLPVTRIEGSQKATRGVHVQDLAKYVDGCRAKAVQENDKMHGRYRRAG